MTTIAFDGKTLAADRLCCSHAGLQRTVSKIFDCAPYWYGGAGDIAEVALVAEWLASGAKPADRPTFDEGGCHGMAVHRETGHVFTIVGKRPTLWRFHDPFHAEGSGRDYAIVAMSNGLSAAEAVRMAAKFDMYTGTDVDEVVILSAPLPTNNAGPITVTIEGNEEPSRVARLTAEEIDRLARNPNASKFVANYSAPSDDVAGRLLDVDKLVEAEDGRRLDERERRIVWAVLSVMTNGVSAPDIR